MENTRPLRFLFRMTHHYMQHARSDFFINTSFWVRCRYTQTALIAHPTRGYKDMSTLHPRWDVPSVASTLHKGV